MFERILPIAALLWILIVGGNSKITAKPVDTEVKVGDSTYFNCSISDPSADISWFHHPVGKRTDHHQYVYTAGQLISPYDRRFRIDKQISAGSFNLVLLNAQLSDAGLYVCQNGGANSAVYAELIVIEADPTCATNIGNSELIGPNSCRLQETVVQLNCSISYKGNVPPQWNIANVKGGIVSPVPQSSCFAGDGRVTCNYAEYSEIGMHGSYFVCHTNRSGITRYNCKTEVVKIHYALGERNPAQKIIGDIVTCPLNTSSTDCSYRWIWSDGNAEETTMSENKPLEIAKTGWYRCQVSCPFAQSPCNFDAMLFLANAPTDFSTNSYSSTAVIIAVMSTFAFCCGIGVVVLVLIVCRRKKPKGDSESSSPEKQSRTERASNSPLANTDAEDALLIGEGDDSGLSILINGASVDPKPIEEAVKRELPFISNCVLVGHQRKFLSILLTIKAEIDPITSEPLDKLSPEVIEWIKRHHGNATTVSDLAEKKCKPLVKAIKEGVDEVNSTANAHGHDIKKWAILPRELSVRYSELDVEGNVQRESVARNFKSIIDQIYADSGRDSLEK